MPLQAAIAELAEWPVYAAIRAERVIEVTAANIALFGRSFPL